MSDIAICVENLSKQYHIGGKRERYKTVPETLSEAATAPSAASATCCAARPAPPPN